MIPESLLFQVDYIVPHFTGWDVFFSFFFAILGAFIFSFQTKNKSQKDLSSPVNVLPVLDDSHFESKMAHIVRQTVLNDYPSKHSYAHTAEEVQKYVEGDSLGKILSHLEQGRYQSIPMNTNERKRILESFKK